MRFLQSFENAKLITLQPVYLTSKLFDYIFLMCLKMKTIKLLGYYY